MGNNNLKPKIFLSCGQSSDKEVVGFDKNQEKVSEEIEGFITENFKEKFEVYRAITKRKNETILEAIFNELLESEYLLFIDFHEGNGRGSLFSNQELAVACALKIPFTALRQEGIERDGILRYIQEPFLEFNSEKQLYELIEGELKNWESDWKNKLVLERDDGEKSSHFTHMQIILTKQDGDKYHPKCSFYHIKVRNLHNRKIARNCYGYIKSIIDLETEKPIYEEPLKTIELKWAGFTLPNATILPKKQSRDLDAFFIIEDITPPKIYFSTHTDSTEYRFRIEKEGNYAITYTVISDDFPPVENTFYLHLGKTIDEIIFTNDKKSLPKIEEVKIETKSPDVGETTYSSEAESTTGDMGTFETSSISGSRIQKEKREEKN